MTRIGTKGQVVIPKEIRDRLGLRPGGKVNFLDEGDSVRILPARGIAHLEGILKGEPLTAQLEADRREEERRDGDR